MINISKKLNSDHWHGHAILLSLGMGLAKKNTGNYALVTGAAGGIGYEFAKVLAVNRFNLILADMNKERLTEAKQRLTAQFAIDVITLNIDLTEAGAASKIATAVEHVPVEILVNNAGFGVKGEFVTTDLTRELQMIKMHVSVLTELTKFMLKPMLKRKKGRILNVASVAAFYPGPTMAVYYASKAYILSFSQAIARELKGSGVTVTVLCPGPTKTGFQQVVGSENSTLSRWNRLASPQDVAEYGYKAMMSGRTVAIPGNINKLLLFLSPIFGRKVKSAIIAKLQKVNSRP